MHCDANLILDTFSNVKPVQMVVQESCILVMMCALMQAGAWPLVQTNLPTFSVPQVLEKSVRMVSYCCVGVCCNLL